MTDVESPARIATCLSGGVTVGFAGVATPAQLTVETMCSCGGRHPMSPSAEPAAVGVFAAAGRLAQTWADPAKGTLGRGALSQTRLFYSVTGGPGATGRVVRFSTDFADLAGVRSGIWPAAVAATLAGHALPVPLTPYEGVFQLACGTTLSTFGARERLSLQELDLDELVDDARRLVGRSSDPREVVRRALRHAIADVLDTAGTDGLVGDGGGLGAAALASVGSARLRRLHVHVDVPVLDRRRGRLLPDTVVIDGTPHWRQTCEGPHFGLPHDCDPWPPAPNLLRQAGCETVPLLSGSGLVRLLAGAGAETGRLRTGWLQLTMASPFPALFGRSGWRAWHPPGVEVPASVATPEPVPVASSHEHGDPVVSGPGGWISPAVGAAGVAVTSARTASHLVPVDDDPETVVPGAAVVQAVVDGLERFLPPAPGEPRQAPVLVCAHPVVVGAVVQLARHGRLRVRRRDGYIQSAPLLHDLVPDGWRPSDVTPGERDRLLAAAFVTRRLATREQRAKLLAQVEGSPWIVADRLSAVLSDSRRVLFEAQALQRLYVTAARHPGVLSSGDQP